MTSLGLLCVVFGILIAVSRAPLIFAPEWERKLILSWLAMPGFMRGFGLFALLIGAGLAYFSTGQAGWIATLLLLFGLLMLVVGVVSLPFPQLASGLATRVWASFSTTTLRILGTLAVLFGIWLVFVGLSL